jgi:DUF4097 and DUF4098 domain-containing protein YvlB
VAAAACLAQEPGDKVTVPFSDPNAPKQLKVNLMNGSITIRGYEGKEAIVEARSSSKGRRERREPRADGLRKLEIFGTGLTVEEQNNVLRVGAGHGGDSNLVIQVPSATSVTASIVNGGDLIIENISGEIDANNTNGGIKMSNISGTVVAHALNDDVTVKMDKVTPGKPMSFSSLNGDIDVTFPAETKARLKLKSEHGDIYSDFDIKMEASARQPVVEESRQRNGKYRVQFDRAMYGTINGGGQEIQLTTLNGKILIRKGK